jgi:hypothetical protein
MKIDLSALKPNMTATEAKNVAVNTPKWLWQKTTTWIAYFLVRCKIWVMVRYAKSRRWYWDKKRYVQMRLAGYKFIPPGRFLTEFPPRKNHKPCNEKGYVVVQLPDRRKVIRFCTCVTDKYKTSGKKYIVIQP